MDRVGARAPARFLCITEENSFSKMIEIAHTVASALEDLSFVVAAFYIAISPRDIHRVQDLLEPVMVSFGTVLELSQFHQFNREYPVYKPLFTFDRGAGANDSKEVVF